MDSIEIPKGAIGRPGMVALVRRMPDAVAGRLVFITGPAGYLTELINSSKPRFAWRARCATKSSGDPGWWPMNLCVADAGLVPVGQFGVDEVEGWIEHQMRATLDDSMRDLRDTAGASSMPIEEFASLVYKLYPMVQIELAMEVVPIEEALREIGFVPDGPDSDVLVWVTAHAGIELRFQAGLNHLFKWTLVSTCHKPREAIWDEIHLPLQARRGVFFESVFAAWNRVFPDDPVPNELVLGHDYRAHRQLIVRSQLQLPTIKPDPRTFRAIRMWLLGDPDSWDDWIADEWVVLRQEGSMLRIKHRDAEYGCPSYGQWVEPREISLADLAAMPVRVRRQRVFDLVQHADAVELNGWRMASRPHSGN